MIKSLLVGMLFLAAPAYSQRDSKTILLKLHSSGGMHGRDKFKSIFIFDDGSVVKEEITHHRGPVAETVLGRMAPVVIKGINAKLDQMPAGHIAVPGPCTQDQPTIEYSSPKRGNRVFAESTLCADSYIPNYMYGKSLKIILDGLSEAGG